MAGNVLTAVHGNAHQLTAPTEQGGVQVLCSYNFGDSYATNGYTLGVADFTSTINTVFGSDISVSTVDGIYPIGSSSDGTTRGMWDGTNLEAWDYATPGEIANTTDLSAAGKTVYLLAYLTLA